MISLDMFTCLAIAAVPAALFVQYWLLRLAVRGGVEDAARRQQSRLAEQQRWNSRPASTDGEPGTAAGT